MRTLFALAQLILFRKFPRIYKPMYFLYKRISDRELYRWMDENIKEGMVVVDVGANIGDNATYLSKKVGPTGKVYSFEPDPTNFEYLKRIVKGLDNVVIENVAVGSKNEMIKLYLNDDLNVDHQTYDSGEGRRTIEVQSITLDKYLNGQEVDFLKIDIQGYDYQAMLGATETLKRSKDIKVIGEFWPYGLIKAGTQPSEYLDFLHGHGFKVDFEEKALNKEMESNLDYYTDFLAEKAS
jgi:FkbM family methyltransferase